MEVGEEEAAMREREGRQQSFFEREGERGQEVVQGVDACYSLLRWGVYEKVIKFAFPFFQPYEWILSHFLFRPGWQLFEAVVREKLNRSR